MAEKIKLKKTLQDREDLDTVISKEFRTFVQPEDLPDSDSINELFRLYDKFYLEIPLEGPQSHTYLIEESRKLIDIQVDNSEIQPLLDEITTLREQLLLANEQLFDLEQTNNG